MQPTVSIIVPVYNAEKTLERCVDSILNQSFEDFELFLVDDGSTDGSGALCDAYAARDGRVQVFHQENAGVSAARNLALDHAGGEYLQFLDSDDWITPDATVSLVRSAREHQCDLVIADFYRVCGERVSHKGDIDEDAVLSREEYAAHMMENPADFYYGVLWNKLYRRDIVAAHHLRMDPEISWCEDFMFNLEYIRHAQRFYALQVPIYYYVKTKGSLASQSLSITKTVRMKLTVFEYYHQFFKTVLDEEEYEKSRLKVYRFLVDAAGDGGVPPTILPGATKLGNERLQVCPELLEGRSLLHDAFRRRKLLDRFLETVALKHDLSLAEVRLLLYLRQVDFPADRRTLADFAGVSRSAFTVLSQRLAAKDLVRLEDVRSKDETKRVRVTFPPQCRPVLSDLAQALADCRRAAEAGFTTEECGQYRLLSGKLQESIRRAL
ncbi:glycosyltransferase [uncultured Oscillibacter sp.]|uniref:glycosyltransferase n=1 Tax=uncultured Oscillibacter sp. TaxID=876091 RepID=UPI0025D3F157|nr:glycosyltransferase [uncultured Oscillibacter sp.]